MTERATRKVLMSPELMEQWATRDEHGNLLRWDWRQPDGEWWEPTISVDYADNLVTGIPNWWAIWDERIKFDVGFSQGSLAKLQYYQSLPLLSSTNQTNFLTTRYPNLMRVACMAAAADYMKDDTEYQKQFGRLGTMIEKISNENDMQYRGMELDPEIP